MRSSTTIYHWYKLQTHFHFVKIQKFFGNTISYIVILQPFLLCSCTVVFKKTTLDKVNKNLLLTKIRNLGSHKHNMRILEAGEGFLDVVHRPTQKDPNSTFLPCQYCLGYYSRSELWRHCERCPFGPKKSG